MDAIRNALLALGVFFFFMASVENNRHSRETIRKLSDIAYQIERLNK